MRAAQKFLLEESPRKSILRFNPELQPRLLSLYAQHLILFKNDLDTMHNGTFARQMGLPLLINA